MLLEEVFMSFKPGALPEEIQLQPVQTLRGRNIILGVTGSSAIYKSIDLARRLIRMGATVRVVMTRFATRLISPDLFHWATGQKPLVEMTGETEHIDLAKWGDALVVAPATLNTMCKIAYGVLDELLTLTAVTMLGSGKKVIIVPTMNTRLLNTPQYNKAIKILREEGVFIIPPKIEEDKAKYPPIEDLSHCIDALISRGRDLEGARVLVTAGATLEHIDPVRVITNPSSGLMGILVAREAACRGASVTLVHGNITVEPPYMVKTIRVESTEDMARVVRDLTEREEFNIGVFAAAPVDYKPVSQSSIKISTRAHERISLELEATPKVIKNIARRPGYIVAFAAETARGEELIEKTREKLIDYGADLVVGNNVLSDTAGFGKQYLDAVVVSKEGVVVKGLLSKYEVARLIIDKAVGKIKTAPS
jgi:phosphopantothenoylcysteine decarboxylase/phosphopantothenate--cysteine ligase